MKFVAGLQVFNESCYTYSCLTNLYPHFDKIIIVDGAWQKTRLLSQAAGSNDGTLELIKAFPDVDKKIVVVKYAGACQEDHRRRALDEALQYLQPNDFYWLGDMDEFAHHNDWEKLKNDLPNIKDDCLKFPWNLYWNDLRTFEASSSPARVFRVTEGMYADGTCGARYVNKDRYKPVMYSGFRLYHPSYTKSLKRQALKFSYRATNDKRFPHYIDKGIVYRGNGYSNNKEWFKVLKTGKIKDLPIELQRHHFSSRRWLKKERMIIEV